jgi:hypothetical protein
MILNENANPGFGTETWFRLVWNPFADLEWALKAWFKVKSQSKFRHRNLAYASLDSSLSQHNPKPKNF